MMEFKVNLGKKSDNILNRSKLISWWNFGSSLDSFQMERVQKISMCSCLYIYISFYSPGVPYLSRQCFPMQFGRRMPWGLIIEPYFEFQQSQFGEAVLLKDFVGKAALPYNQWGQLGTTGR